MSTRTKRRLLVCALVLAFTIPAETILLKAVSTTDTRQAVDLWASGLSADTLDSAAGAIQAYPFLYRRAIMKALSPAKRSQVWRSHIQGYIDSHPGLDGAAVSALRDAIDVASPEAFASRSDTISARVSAVGAQVTAALGKDEADYVLYRLGPRDGTFASLEPIGMKLANWVRKTYVAIARQEDCDCNLGWGCESFGTYCSDTTSCNVDDSWPACGLFWTSNCDGLCKAGIRM